MNYRVLIPGLLLAAAAVGGGVWYFHHRPARPAPVAPPAPEDDPRLTSDTPYKNVRPDVAYVGDARCAECHRGVAAHYARHPMGRSMAAAGPADAAPLGPAAHNPFERRGSLFRVEARGGRPYHVEERRDPSGRVVAAAEAEAEIRYVVGSGTRGKSYLLERDGRLFQSPISWYGDKKIWDLSPGYPDDLHFSRPVGPRCLACHCNAVEPVDGALNSYREPVFRGLTVGCERCHGPGELHVKAREADERVGKPDHTIVNPRHLAPELRDAVCQQCHLQGEQRVLPRGRGPFDFRPGLPLGPFWAVFVAPPELTASYRTVGQTEQLRLSRCAQASAGGLGCISCHDPHRRPEASERVAFFRGRCLQCHEPKGCTEDRAARAKREDSCVDCHMVADGSRNIPHIAVTDHRILRRPDTSAPRVTMSRPGRPLIEPFDAGAARPRDLGVALAEMVRGGRAGPEAARPALPLLEAATRERPDDAEAREAQAICLFALDRPAEALAAYEEALRLKPNLERALADAANLCGRLGRTEQGRRSGAARWRSTPTCRATTPGWPARWPGGATGTRPWSPATRRCAWSRSASRAASSGSTAWSAPGGKRTRGPSSTRCWRCGRRMRPSCAAPSPGCCGSPTGFA